MTSTLFTASQTDPATISIRGALDAGSAPELRAAVEAVSARNLTIDASNLSFIDAAGLTEFVRAAGSHALRVLDASVNVARVFALAGLAGLLSPTKAAGSPPFA